MAFPPAPAPDVEWTKLGLAVTDMVNGHIESTYSVEGGEWTTPKFVTDPYLRIHGLAPALNYGQQVYEGLKAYRTSSGKIQIFRPHFHAARMQHSADVVSIPPVPIEHFIAAVNAAVAHNAEWVPPHSSGAALYIRPVLFGSRGHLALTPPTEYMLCVYVQPFSSYHGISPLPAVIMEDFDRAAPKGTGHAKIGGNYAPVMKWSEKATKAGFPMTLHLDSKSGEDIDEFSTSGFLGVQIKKQEGEKQQVVLVVPKSDNIINSVTSDSLMAIGKDLGYQVEHRTVKYAELSTFSEVMAVGTAACLVPIRSITHQSHGDQFVYTGEKTTGPVCQKLYVELTGTQRGDSEDGRGWCFEVKQVLDGVDG
ncbi:Branched-chain amino acid aminotransferase II [Penicillium maclennaniae]|uniref:Branched-chain amino acid aminotransferase II n=1 Tax=Penicillium maclennaniae TaxID=1343394 RepID=UPI00253F8C66|nr:Branched-chain amino acid aminotransferase II [Penicillium maclennaniae]KAJ5674927.1 Branched-chain amino acid aminotransferase II [Penicillium maclennaniae]